jgi:hypothetical protein
MQRRARFAVLATSVVAAVGVGTGIATATGGDTDTPITGPDRENAEAAAVEYTGGRVTETEVGDEDSYYEVEVELPDGRRVDVQLDKQFTVVGTDADRHESGER